MQSLTPDLIPSATDLLAEAFFDNPAHVYMCPDPEKRPHQLRAILGLNLRAQPDLSQSFCLATEKQVDGMGFWTRVGRPGPTTIDMIRSGALRLPLLLGFEGMRTVLSVKSQIDAEVEAAVGQSDCWYLNNMVVRSSLRGTGVGTRMLTEQFVGAARWNPNGLFALSTQKKENVTFYQRLGFEVAREGRIGEGPNAFPNWTMLCNRGQGRGESEVG